MSNNEQKRRMREAVEAEWYGRPSNNLISEFEQNVAYMRDVASYMGPIIDDMVGCLSGQRHRSAGKEATDTKDDPGLDKE